MEEWRATSLHGMPDRYGYRVPDHDLHELAFRAAAPPVRIAYKNLCFGGFGQTWEQALALDERAAMPYLGFLLDTFNMASAVGSRQSVGLRAPICIRIAYVATLNAQLGY
ncbi:hypothetical protein Micbo1qcDRAFT_209832 [Microdochium bolleyi]|uniref:Uncharacterized protein n=1 Tax=Microdochium bolleyi TaxID=196109 RepID=A0A136IKU6_9PEZI|nr:hypothetical protein Micbo1qcDRAFT_209832 [Microdochium bolleyi]